MACPPYLITTVWPWNLFSQGSASISVAALADASATASLHHGHVEYAEFSWT